MSIVFPSSAVELHPGMGLYIMEQVKQLLQILFEYSPLARATTDPHKAIVKQLVAEQQSHTLVGQPLKTHLSTHQLSRWGASQPALTCKRESTPQFCHNHHNRWLF